MPRYVLTLAIAMLLAPSIRAQSPSPLLTPSDLETAAGLTGIQLSTRPAPGRKPGDLSFVQADGTAVLVVSFFDAAAFEQAKKPVESMVGDTKITTRLFHASVAGVGDDAFDGPDEAVPSILYVRAGSRAFALTTFFHGSRSIPNMRITPAQLRAIGKLIATRLGRSCPESEVREQTFRTRRPFGQARRPRILGVFEGGATPPGGMPRPEYVANF